MSVVANRGNPLKSLSAALGLLMLIDAGAAHALPSFARQTGEECAACHVGGIGPQLTPHGQKFKIGGYLDGDSPDNWVLPVAVQGIVTSTHTDKGVPDGAAEGFKDNNNTVFQEGSLFLAGRYYGSVGGFVQETYSGVDHHWAWDNVDLRFARTLKLGGKDSIVGLSLNNSPTTQDPFNTLPAWNFPYVSSDLTPGYLGEPLLAGGLEQVVAGLTAYGYFDDWLYAEVGTYHDLGGGFLRNVGLYREDRINLSGTAPYARLNIGHEFNHQMASVGLVAMNANVLSDPSSNDKDKYRDVGVDASYQFLGTRKHIFSVNSRYLHESQKLRATFAGGGADRSSHHLNEYNLNGSYYYLNTWGATLGLFGTSGSRDATLYAPADIEGSRSGKPDSRGMIYQVDWTPWGKEGSWMEPLANLRLALQYTAYDKFNGSSSNYDGAGRDASDNNTLMGFLWFAF